MTRPKSKNARQGIATLVQSAQGHGNTFRPKSKNARQGIATLHSLFILFPLSPQGPKSKNARQGIATPGLLAHAARRTTTIPKAKMPARALRPAWRIAARARSGPSQKQKCPPGHCDHGVAGSGEFFLEFYPKSKNARQGIATPGRHWRAFTENGIPKAKMPARALRPGVRGWGNAPLFTSQKQKCPPGHCDPHGGAPPPGLTPASQKQKCPPGHCDPVWPYLSVGCGSGSQKQKCPPGHCDECVWSFKTPPSRPIPKAKMPARALRRSASVVRWPWPTADPKSKNARQGIATRSSGTAAWSAWNRIPKAKMPARALRLAHQRDGFGAEDGLIPKAKMPARALRPGSNGRYTSAPLGASQKQKCPPGHGDGGRDASAGRPDASNSSPRACLAGRLPRRTTGPQARAGGRFPKALPKTQGFSKV